MSRRATAVCTFFAGGLLVFPLSWLYITYYSGPVPFARWLG